MIYLTITTNNYQINIEILLYLFDNMQYFYIDSISKTGQIHRTVVKKQTFLLNKYMRQHPRTK